MYSPKKILRYCLIAFSIFSFTHSVGDEHFYSCLDQKVHTCPIDFFVHKINQETNVSPSKIDIKNELLNIYHDSSLLYGNNCWKIKDELCLLELQKYYDLYSLELLPFPLSKEYRCSHDKIFIHIMLDGNITSNTVRNACEHFVLAFLLALSLKVATGSNVGAISGVALYTASFLIISKAYQLWSERKRRYF